MYRGGVGGDRRGVELAHRAAGYVEAPPLGQGRPVEVDVFVALRSQRGGDQPLETFGNRGLGGTRIGHCVGKNIQLIARCRFDGLPVGCERGGGHIGSRESDGRFDGGLCRLQAIKRPQESNQFFHSSNE